MMEKKMETTREIWFRIDEFAVDFLGGYELNNRESHETRHGKSNSNWVYIRRRMFKGFLEMGILFFSGVTGVHWFWA